MRTNKPPHPSLPVLRRLAVGASAFWDTSRPDFLEPRSREPCAEGLEGPGSLPKSNTACEEGGGVIGLIRVFD
jgi:hypothetical protein